MSTQIATISISVPKQLVTFTDRLAAEASTTRSKIISDCLAQYARKIFEAELIEGYKAMASERRQFAELAFEAGREVVPDWE